MTSSKQKPLPSGDHDFLEWAENFKTKLAPLIEGLGIPPADYELIVALKNTFAAALVLTDAPSTKNPGTVAAKNDAHKALEKGVRKFIGEHLRYNDALTNQNREDLRIPVPDTTHTPIPPPTTHPVLELKISAIRQVKLYFRDPASETGARPYGVNGAVVLYDIRETPPARTGELKQNVLATRSPFKLNFEEDDRGKRIYVAVCWQNERGQRGPFSEVQSIFIP
jgi:hypothetical protein